MPVRRIPIGRRSLTGRHNWHPQARGVAFESALERDFITFMVFDPAFVAIEEQPVRIDYEWEGRSRHYTPDFLVELEGAAPLLAEVKFAAELEKSRDKLQPKLDAGRAYADTRGWRFEVWTEHDIRGTRLENAGFLSRYFEPEPDPGLCARLLRQLARVPAGVASAGKLIDACFSEDDERGRGLWALWHLVATGRLDFDADHPINNETPLWMAGGADG